MHNHKENVLLFNDCHDTESNVMVIPVLFHNNRDKPATFWVVLMLCRAILGSISCHWECRMVLAQKEIMVGSDYCDMVFGKFFYSISHITFQLHVYGPKQKWA